jgi:hypothetical protein
MLLMISHNTLGCIFSGRSSRFLSISKNMLPRVLLLLVGNFRQCEIIMMSHLLSITFNGFLIDKRLRLHLSGSLIDGWDFFKVFPSDYFPFDELNYSEGPTVMNNHNHTDLMFDGSNR